MSVSIYVLKQKKVNIIDFSPYSGEKHDFKFFYVGWT